MVQHPIPRQITTFEFKLIGFLTLKQFLYLVTSIPLAIITFMFFPIPILKQLLGILIGCIGLALAFIPVNDRPFDVWIKNLVKRLLSPTQYIYHKESKPLYFLENLIFLKDPHIVAAHVESKEKLNAYLLKTQKTIAADQKKQQINNLLTKPGQPIPKTDRTPDTNLSSSLTMPKKPFLAGTVMNSQKIPLPGILIYMKDQKGVVLRLLKTNLHGVFATFNPLPPGEYLFELKDTNRHYFFDTMKKRVENQNPTLFEFHSKELI